MENKVIYVQLDEADIYLLEHFGMTKDAVARVIQNHKDIVNRECKEVICHTDFYINPTHYAYPEGLAEISKDWKEKDDDDDGYPNLYDYNNSYTEIFKDLISFHTPYGGHSSAEKAIKMVIASGLIDSSVLDN